MINHKHGILIIGLLDKIFKSMYQWDAFQNLLFLSLYFQTLQLFNECGVNIFNHYNILIKRKILSTSWQKKNQ